MHTNGASPPCWRIRVCDPAFMAHSADADDNGTSVARSRFQKISSNRPGFAERSINICREIVCPLTLTEANNCNREAVLINSIVRKSPCFAQELPFKLSHIMFCHGQSAIGKKAPRHSHARRSRASLCYANTLCAAYEIDRIIVDRRPRERTRSSACDATGLAAFPEQDGAMGLFEGGPRPCSAGHGRFGGCLATKAKLSTRPIKSTVSSGINSSETIALLKQIKPDAILIYGTSVVKDTVLSLARDICLNMHQGICPYYRGTGCDFWPIVNGDFEMIGATVHQCTSQIDGGSIFEIAHVTCEPGDDLYAVAGRTLVAGTQAYVRVVERYLAGKLQGMAQDLSFGREYRSSDLTLGPELTGRLRMRQMRRNARHRLMPSSCHA